MRPISITLALLGIASQVQAEAQAETVRFITCPIYRDADAGKKSGCWLVEDRLTARRYDVSLSPSKPDWNHEVLVEALITPQSEATAGASETFCGGIVPAAVRTSVLPGPCTRHMLPAEGYTGRKFVLPERNVSPMTVERKVAPPPYAARTFHLFYDFDAAFLIYQYDDYFLDEAIAWIRVAKPKAITVTGYGATTPMTVSGRAMAETDAIARIRAERVGEALVRLGVDKSMLTVRWKNDSQPIDAPGADGLPDQSRRRVDIAATF